MQQNVMRDHNMELIANDSSADYYLIMVENVADDNNIAVRDVLLKLL
jgi:hypothetical protein